MRLAISNGCCVHYISENQHFTQKSWVINCTTTNHPGNPSKQQYSERKGSTELLMTKALMLSTSTCIGFRQIKAWEAASKQVSPKTSLLKFSSLNNQTIFRNQNFLTAGYPSASLTCKYEDWRARTTKATLLPHLNKAEQVTPTTIKETKSDVPVRWQW